MPPPSHVVFNRAFYLEQPETRPRPIQYAAWTTYAAWTNWPQWRVFFMSFRCDLKLSWGLITHLDIFSYSPYSQLLTLGFQKSVNSWEVFDYNFFPILVVKLSSSFKIKHFCNLNSRNRYFQVQPVVILRVTGSSNPFEAIGWTLSFIMALRFINYLISARFRIQGGGYKRIPFLAHSLRAENPKNFTYSLIDTPFS